MISAYSDRLAVDVADAQALKVKAAAGDKAALAGAAKQFEAMMVAQMLKQMRQTRFADEDDPMSGGEGMKLYRDLLDQQWATQLSKGRGLGFADMMVKAMERLPSAPPPLSEGVRREAEGVSQGHVVDEGAVGSSFAKPSSPQSSPSGRGADLLDSKQSFLERMRPHAEVAAAAIGLPAQFILAHAALESGWGRHEIKDGNGLASHNLFGIKAGRTWDGAVAETQTTEYRQGVPMKMTQQFRAYSDYTSAFTDYANLLKARYGEALAAGNDPVGFARGLVAGGYATDPAYAAKLQSVIAVVAMAGV